MFWTERMEFMWWLFDSGLFGAFFVVIFLIIVGMFVFGLISSIRQWKKNNNSPRLTVEAQVVTKRTDVTHHHDMDNAAMSHTSTRHYVTFQVDSGDRMELSVTGQEYGMLAEGDRGRLTFQGTRYLGFERQQ